MGLTKEQILERDKSLQRLKITTRKDCVGYTFISYKSDDWKKVFEEKVFELQKRGMRVYSDKNFDDTNHPWLEDMEKNLKNASVFIMFISSTYLRSYATLLELLTAIKYNRQIVPIYLEDKYEIFNPGRKVTIQLEDEIVKMQPKEVSHFENLLQSINNKTFANEIRLINMDCYQKICQENFSVLDILESFSRILNNGQLKDNSFDTNINSLIKTIQDAASTEEDDDFKIVFEDSADVPAEEEPAVKVTEPEKEDKICRQVEPAMNVRPVGGNDEKIGAYVQNSLSRLVEEELLTEEVLEKMQDAVWSKNVLHLSYPVLLKLVPNMDIRKQLLDDKGRARYWANPYNIHGEQYCVCNDWYDRHRVYFDDFLTQIKSGQIEMVTSEKAKKSYSLTGDITYQLYGEEYTENQSDMMLRFFAQVLKRHQHMIDELPSYKEMNCVSKTDYTLKENVTDDMKSYFRVCHYFVFDSGKAICVGTAYSLGDKLKKMAHLLKIVGEDVTIFSSNQVALPEIKERAAKSTESQGKSGGRVTKVKNFL